MMSEEKVELYRLGKCKLSFWIEKMFDENIGLDFSLIVDRN